MSYDFIKISDAELVENPSENVSVIIEDGGDIKRVPKSSIGAQADWNENDETNPAYILNKPTNFGGYLYYCYDNYYLYKCENANFTRDNNPVSKEQFEEDFYTSPILLKSYDYIVPIIAYDNFYGIIKYANKTAIYPISITWA